jgi:D-sedoheptulose 7-phosphate isomerase
MNSNNLQTEFTSHNEVMAKTVAQCAGTIAEITKTLTDCFRRGNKVMLCGNGGSAADAQHVAAEFVNRFRFDREALAGLALTTDSSILTCIGNDSSYEFVFSRQVQAIGKKGDVLVGISTSGKSVNVLKALDAARPLGITTIGFTGENGGKVMSPKCDITLAIPSNDTARVQEAQEFVWHVVCGTIEADIFGGPKRA